MLESIEAHTRTAEDLVKDEDSDSEDRRQSSGGVADVVRENKSYINRERARLLHVNVFFFCMYSFS